jgi:hypothetical protein
MEKKLIESPLRLLILELPERTVQQFSDLMKVFGRGDKFSMGL